MTRLKHVLLGAALLVSLSTLLPAQKPTTPAKERTIMRVVAALLDRAHLAEQPLNDEISHRAHRMYLESLDPLKVYFEQADVDGFMLRIDEIDDMIRKGRAEFAHEVFARFLARVEERVKLVESLLAGKFDFTKDEVFVTDGDAVVYARSKAEIRDRWRRRLKYDLLALTADGTSDEDARETLRKRYRGFLERLREENREDILARFVNAVAMSFDPHTVYMPPKAFEDFNMGLTLNYQGIGALLGEEDGHTIIRRVIPGGAVERQGRLGPRDRITAVAQGDDGRWVDIVGMRLTDVVKLIRGEEGSVVRLAVLPAAGGSKQVHRLVRSKIELEENGAKSEIVTMPGGKPESPRRIGVIDLPSFYRDSDAEWNGEKNFRSSTRDVERMLRDFAAKDVDAVVLDLRRNGGGFLPEAVGIAGLFLEKGTVVQVKGIDRRVRRLDDPDEGAAWTGPLVVLVSRASASASEIVAGAIKDYRRGLVVGDASTHGKGTVQSPVDLAEQIEYPSGPGSLGVLKLTIRQFYRPDGQSTQLKGVPSDVEIPSLLSLMEAEGELPYALPYDSISSARHDDDDLVDRDMVTKLRESSSVRRKGSAYFHRLETRLLAYEKLKRRSDVPLDREAFMKLRAQLDQATKEPDGDAAAGEGGADTGGEGAKVDEKEDGREEEGEKKGGAAADPWFREVLAITADYLDLLRGRRA